MAPDVPNNNNKRESLVLAAAAEESAHFQKQFAYLSASRRSFQQQQSARTVVQEEPSHHHETAVTAETTLPLTKRLWQHVQQFRYWSGILVNHQPVQMFIVYLIAINAIMMGIGTYDFVTQNPATDQAFEIIDRIFLVLFTIELAMQFAFYGWRLFLDGWLVFDLIVVTVSWAFAELQIIRAFRIFRAFRLITRVKVMKNLVLALFGVVPRMFAIGVLLMLVSYIFAVMFTQLFKDFYEDNLTEVDYFGRIDLTFFTLFQIMTLDNWASISREVTAIPGYGWAWFPIIIFVIVTGFVVVNLIIAVICDSISALNEDDRAKLHGDFEEVEEEADEYYENNNNINDDDDDDVTSSSAEQTRPDMKERLALLEDRTETVANMQIESLKTLELLTQRLQADTGVLPLPTMPLSSSSSSSSSPAVKTS